MITRISDNIPVLARSEIQLDTYFDDSELAVEGYRLYRRDGDKYGGGVAFYVQEHVSAVLWKDIMSTDIERIWLQIHLPHCKPILVGCRYRPPGSNVKYFDRM